MNGKAKGTIAFGIVILLGSFTLLNAEVDQSAMYCDCPETIAYNTELPMSHPINRCASDRASLSVSWLSWVTGKSNSNSFHYIDLLELLSRQPEATKDKTPTQP